MNRHMTHPDDTRSPRARRWMPALAAAAVASTVLAGPSTAAVTGTEAGSSGWASYVLGQGSATQRALSINTTSGSVTNAHALIDGDGTVTLTTTDAAHPATVVLDWGVESGGRFSINVVSQTPATGTDSSLKVSTSEAEFGLYSASTLAAQAGVGDTTVKVASIDGMTAGATVFIGNVQRTIASVGTAGVNGSGVVLTKPLEKTYYPGTPISVKSTDRISGDPGGSGIVTTQTVAVSAAGTVTPSNLFGGFRYQAIQLTTPGTIVISANTLASDAYIAKPEDYTGSFLSSDDTLNKAWYSGAYTNALTMVTKETTGKSYDVMFDGAKRDRGVWSGDLVIQGPVANHAFGSGSNTYFEGSLRELFDQQAVTGQVAGTTWGGIASLKYFSDTYSDYADIAAIDFYRYTGDKAFAAEFKTKIEAAVAYQATKINANGVIQVSGNAGRDYWQTALAGEVSEFNAVYYQLLTDAAWFETEVGDTTMAAKYTQDAAALKSAMQAHLWSDDLGAYPLGTNSATDLTTIPLDANANALRLGLVPAGKEAALLKILEGGHTPYGSKMTQSTVGAASRADGYGHEIEALGNFWEVQARLASGDATGGLNLARTYWGQQVDTSSPYYTGTTWEFLDQNGVVLRPTDSLAHGWGAGITTVLTEQVAGIEPVGAGYSTWSVKPEVGDLSWAQGSVQTGDGGTLSSRWSSSADAFALDVSAPASTSGTVSIPVASSTTVVTVNGTRIWRKGTFTPTTGVSAAVLVDGRLEVRVAGGAHSFTAAEPGAPAPAVVTASGLPASAGFGTALTTAVAVTGDSPTGSVAVSVDGRKVATAPLKNGVASVSLGRLLAVGRHTLTYAFAGDEDNASSTITRTVTVTKAASHVSLKVGKAPTRRKAGKATVRVTGVAGVAAPGGKVTVTLTKAGRVRHVTGTLKSGSVTVRLPRLAKGAWKASVSYGGSASFQASGTVKAGSVRVK
jgi:hypothetical protein